MIVHLNGKLLAAAEARISPFDRGFLLGDGVYEGLRSYVPDGESSRIIGLASHVERMQAGLNEAGIEWDAARIGPASRELLTANGYGPTEGAPPREAFIYWQVTRGTPPAGEPWRTRVPPRDSRMTPTVFAFCTPQPSLDSVTSPPCKRAVVRRDIRWSLGHLKSISLMGNVMTALDSAEHGGEEAVMVRSVNGQNLVTEGLATNVVLTLRSRDGATELVTPSLESVPILSGVTRRILLNRVPELIERPVQADELDNAAEIMLIGTTTLVTSIVELDGRRIGDGTPGPRATELLGVLKDAVQRGQDDATESPQRAETGSHRR